MNESTNQDDYQPRIVSGLDQDGFFLEPVYADPSPADPGAFLIPGGAIDYEPPECRPGKCYRPDGNDGWDEFDDYRNVQTVLVDNGVPYTYGQVVNGLTYNGIGPVPAWLTRATRPNAWSIWDGQAWVEDEEKRSLLIRQQHADSRNQKAAQAATAIAPLQDAVDLGLATPEETQLLYAWKLYRVMLNRVAIEQEAPDWPNQPT